MLYSVHKANLFEMGFLGNICGGCCSGDTVDRDDSPPSHIIQAKEVKVAEAEIPDVEPINLVVDDETVEDEANEAPADDVATPSNKSPLKKRPLKEPKNKAGRKKIMLTGAAAAVPPCSKEECEGDIPRVTSSKVSVAGGAYLVYSLEQNGSLSILFTKKAISNLQGVLAYIKPATEFAPYHYTDDDGCKIVATNLQTTMQSQYSRDRRLFYEAWSQFMKLASPANGTMYLLEASGLSPPSKVNILLYKDGSFNKAEPLKAIELKDYAMVGILPHSVDHSSVTDNMAERGQFSQTCEEYGAVLML